MGLNRNVHMGGRYYIVVGVDYSRYEVPRNTAFLIDPGTPFRSDFGMLEIPVLVSADIIQKVPTTWRVYPQVGYSLGISNHERRVNQVEFVTDPFYHFVVSRVMCSVKLAHHVRVAFGPHVKSGKLFRGVHHNELGFSLELQAR